MITVYSIGVEIKDRTAREWLRTGNGSIWISLAGKLLPHTAVFFLMGILYNTYLYGFLHFPCNDDDGYYFKFGIYRVGNSTVPVCYRLAVRD
jgi:hypothetical protein